jgi:hypothetical protein
MMPFEVMENEGNAETKSDAIILGFDLTPFTILGNNKKKYKIIESATGKILWIIVMTAF